MSLYWITKAYTENTSLHHLSNCNNSIIFSRGWVAIETEREKGRKGGRIKEKHYSSCLLLSRPQFKRTLGQLHSEVLCKRHVVGSQQVQHWFALTRVQAVSWRDLEYWRASYKHRLLWWSTKLPVTQLTTIQSYSNWAPEIWWQKKSRYQIHDVFCKVFHFRVQFQIKKDVRV